MAKTANHSSKEWKEGYLVKLDDFLAQYLIFDKITEKSFFLKVEHASLLSCYQIENDKNVRKFRLNISRVFRKVLSFNFEFISDVELENYVDWLFWNWLLKIGSKCIFTKV